MAVTDDGLKPSLDTPPASGSAAAGTPVPPPAASPWVPRAVALGLVLAALNLRPAISALGPLLEEVRDSLHMSGTVAGLLTSVPAFCFAVFGGLAPRLARRGGPAVVVFAGMLAITAGLALRPLSGSTAPFLVFSALALAGIAVSNVLMPVVVKRWFPERVGTMTGLYSMALSLGTAAAAAVSVPLTDALGGGWRLGLGSWSVLGVLAAGAWALVLKDRASRRAAPATAGSAGDAAPGGGVVPAPAAAGVLRVTKSPTAWALACFFGLQSTVAYITMGWLPQIFRDAGVSASSAGLMLSVTMGMGVPLAFVLPRLASRMRHQGPLVLALTLCGFTACAGLWWAPAGGAWVWAVALGIANCAFPVALTMINLRSRSSAGVAKLSAFAQSTGYLLSIPGPLLVGMLHDATGGWHAPLLLVAAFLLGQLVMGALAGRDRVIEDGH